MGKADIVAHTANKRILSLVCVVLQPVVNADENGVPNSALCMHNGVTKLRCSPNALNPLIINGLTTLNGRSFTIHFPIDFDKSGSLSCR